MITAGGIVNADRETTVPLAATGSKATAIVMDDSPCVLSLGKRCMQEGFSFEWNAGENPVLVTPEGNCHTLDLQNLVPVMPVVGRAELGETLAEPVASVPSGPEPTNPPIGGSRDHALTVDALPETLYLRDLPEGEDPESSVQEAETGAGGNSCER